MLYLHFSETPEFLKHASKLIGEDEIAHVQLFLCGEPTRGEIIPGSGGIRKLRWKLRGGGKRGGTRILYYYAGSRGRIYLLDIYSKNEKIDVTAEEISRFRNIVKKWLQKG